MAWVAGDPFIKSVESAQPFWVGRAVAGTMMFFAHIVFAYNVYRMTWAKAPLVADKPRMTATVPA
jgi:cytochrome c oxidase cbb3-type subunit 1